MDDDTGRCGHQSTDLESELLLCAHVGCGEEPTVSVVSVGPSLADRLCWRIAGSCDSHQAKIKEMAKSDLADHPAAGPNCMAADVPLVLAWIHSDDRCNLGCVSIVHPRQPTRSHEVVTSDP